MERGVYTADSLLALGFVDSLMTESNVKEMLKELTNNKSQKDKNKLNLVNIGNYINSESPVKPKITDRKKQIAIIYPVGAVMDDGGLQSFLPGFHDNS